MATWQKLTGGDKVGFIEANAAFALAHPEIGPQVKEALARLVTSVA